MKVENFINHVTQAMLDDHVPPAELIKEFAGVAGRLAESIGAISYFGTMLADPSQLTVEQRASELKSHVDMLLGLAARLGFNEDEIVNALNHVCDEMFPHNIDQLELPKVHKAVDVELIGQTNKFMTEVNELPLEGEVIDGVDVIHL